MLFRRTTRRFASWPRASKSKLSVVASDHLAPVMLQALCWLRAEALKLIECKGEL